MREIKFRAWDPDHGEMITKSDMRTNKEGVALMISLEGSLEDVAMERFDIHNIPLMQYTGLKDKNGAEIYESDKIEITYHNPMEPKEEKTHGVVKWLDGGFFIDDKELDTLHDVAMPTYAMEVIGNIYENKELLKETK